MLTVPQQFPCRDEAECQKTRLFLPRLPSSTVLMLWPMLGGYRFGASQAEYLKTGLKKKKIKKQLSGCRRKMPASPCAVGTQGKKGAFLWQM